MIGPPGDRLERARVKGEHDAHSPTDIDIVSLANSWVARAPLGHGRSASEATLRTTNPSPAPVIFSAESLFESVSAATSA